MSKLVRGAAKQAAKHAKEFIPSTGNEYADAAIKTGLDVAESQANADAKTSLKDRLKMAGGDVISGVADTVDNPAVSIAANVAKVSGKEAAYACFCLLQILASAHNNHYSFITKNLNYLYH